MEDTSQDALSDVLRMIHLKGCVYFQSDFSPPWGMEMGAGTYAQYHVVVRGQCWLTMDDEHRLLATGDVVLLPHGDAHALLNDPATDPTPGIEVLTSIQSGSKPFQDGETSARLLCGHFEFDRTLNHPLIPELPRLIHVKGMGNQAQSWLEAVIPMLVGETGAVQPGTDIMVERLAEVLLIQVLRSHLLEQSQAPGFLAALGDKRINSALKFIHLRADQAVTLSDIAKSVGMSRSGLAVRFKEMVGDTPLNYLTSWRMLNARKLLKSGRLPLMDVAERVGYTSEAAFSRAFKRENAQSPSAYRRSAAYSQGQ